MNFIQTALGPNPSAAFDLMSKAGQAETTGQQLDARIGSGALMVFYLMRIAANNGFTLDIHAPGQTYQPELP
jgi:hypothetical protein